MPRQGTPSYIGQHFWPYPSCNSTVHCGCPRGGLCPYTADLILLCQVQRPELFRLAERSYGTREAPIGCLGWCTEEFLDWVYVTYASRFPTVTSVQQIKCSFRCLCWMQRTSLHPLLLLYAHIYHGLFWVATPQFFSFFLFCIFFLFFPVQALRKYLTLRIVSLICVVTVTDFSFQWPSFDAN